MPTIPPSTLTLATSFPTATHAALYTAIFIGLGLWLFGRRLARTTCSMVGLLSGLAVGLAVASGVAGNDMALLTIILCSLGGAVLAWLLYRIWMSLSLATLLALAGPVTLLVWQGVAVMPAMKNSSSIASAIAAPAPTSPAPSHATKPTNTGIPGAKPQSSSPAPSAASQTPNSPATQPSANADVPPQPKTSSPTVALAAVNQDSSFDLSAAVALPSLSSDQVSSVLQMASTPTNFLKTSWVQDVLSYVLSIRNWYPKLTPRQQDLGVLLAAGGAIVGLITGLAFPQFAASVVSSLVGASLIVPAGYRLLMPYLPAQVLNHSGPRWALLAVSLITILGLFIQWTTKRRPTDK